MITVDNLTFTYPGGAQPAVKDVSFTLNQGEILGFLGPSGAGKTTTQRILTGLLKGYSGHVSAFGRGSTPGATTTTPGSASTSSCPTTISS